MKSHKVQPKARVAQQKKKSIQKTTNPTKTIQRRKTTRAKSTKLTTPQFTNTTRPILPTTSLPQSFALAPTATRSFNSLSKQRRFPLSDFKRNFSGCGSSCGCGPTESAPEPEPVSSCGTRSPLNTHESDEFNEPQYNDQNIKTIEKMRKQQRDFSLRLYRSILRAHRVLPPDMRMLGDAYVQEEFKLHKNAKPEHLQPFFEQWIDYLGHLRNAFDNPDQLGRNIPIDTIDQLDDEQKEKLFKMHDETYRIFGGELNEADVGRTFDEIPDHLKDSGIFGDNLNSSPEDVVAKPKLNLTNAV